MKDTMNKPDIASYHKLLLEEVPLKKISNFLQVSITALKKFTPEIMEEISRKQRDKNASLAKK